MKKLNFLTNKISTVHLPKTFTSSTLRLTCLIVALAATSTFTACKNTPSSKTTSTAEATGTTIINTTEAEITQTTQAPVPSEDISVGWCNADKDGLRIRSGPGTDYKGIGGLHFGEKVNILSKEGDWYKIKFGNSTGYANAQYIQATEITTAEETVTTAINAQ